MRYKNIDEFESPGPRDFVKWRMKKALTFKKLEYKVPTEEKPKLDLINKPESNIQITWLGHATFLIQINGRNIITDPVFSKYMGNVKRLTKSDHFPKDLPKIDIVLISHSHYDHLSFSSIRKLKGNLRFVIPKGLSKTFERRNYKDYNELGWHEYYKDERVKITFVPSRHWSRRGIIDTNKSLWGGYIIESLGIEEKVYFVGDSGYFSGFKEIGKRFSPEICLIPIGCYDPEWFMLNQHMTPEEGVKVFKEVKGEVFIPMHYDSYPLADDHPKEALDRLYKEWNRTFNDDEKLKVLKIDETIIF